MTTPLTTPRKSQAEILFRFVAWEFWRNFRMLDATFFVLVLPAAMYLMFGVAMDQGEMPAGYGNVSAYVMTSMAVYGAVIATTAMAGSAAVERTMGWGRQLNMTGLTEGNYILGKMLMALLMAISPILIVYIVGAMTGATFDSFTHWLTSAALCVAVAVPFSLYGLAFALLFRSETAVSAASGFLVLFAFFGNLFIPLGGVLLDIGKFTPLYGPAMLARWPQTEGMLIPMEPGAAVEFESMWVLLANIGAWTAIFALLCVLGSRRRTAR
ncbi:MAG TPA: ABC transporter permease [Enteractinococcus helveticum]|uniref:ABC transporter permease n=1 Tax=Enteractinococcus helveticum TaxID=1837282 RepID=A0A921K7W3_9MICC|nr:ABC transporter permease [Enteractinococcus helveticum]HJF15097.1 ABC transporter permease [Enteractinococcus helveticum]